MKSLSSINTITCLGLVASIFFLLHSINTLRSRVYELEYVPRMAYSKPVDYDQVIEAVKQYDRCMKAGGNFFHYYPDPQFGQYSIDIRPGEFDTVRMPEGTVVLENKTSCEKTIRSSPDGSVISTTQIFKY